MNVYEHFGLAFPPFDGAPDPRFYVDAPSHEEALATLQYTIYGSKGCCVLVGDTGSGKTLLGRMLCKYAADFTSVLWVDGIGQPAETTEACIYPTGAFTDPLAPATVSATLAEWSHTKHTDPHGPLLLIDDADALDDDHWQDVVSLFTRATHLPKPLSIALFGSSDLLERLGSRALARLQRRVFRTCTLEPLSGEQVALYIAARLSAAGGDDEQIFDGDAIELVQRVTRGNPALINQLCDNALIDACTEGRSNINATDILTAVHAIVGSEMAQRLCLSAFAPSTEGAPPQSPTCPKLPALAESVARRRRATDGGRLALPNPTVVKAAPGAFTTSVWKQEPGGGSSKSSSDGQLRSLESKLARALSTVRNARVLQDEVESSMSDGRPPAPPLP